MVVDGLLEFAHLGSGFLDPQGTIVRAQPSLRHLLKAGTRPVEGHPLTEFMHTDDRARCADFLQRSGPAASAAPAPRACELRLVQAEHGMRWVELAVSRASAPAGASVAAPEAFAFLLTDITARKQAQAALQHSESMLKEAQATAQLGSFHWDAQTQGVTWSDQLFRIYGRDPDQFVPSFQAYLDAVHPQDLVRVRQRLQDAIDTRTEFAHDYRLVLPDGRLRWVHARGRPVIDASGAWSGLQGTCQDITARKEGEQALEATVRDKEALLRELHHRVKNNLQLVSSLLRLERERSSPRDAQDMLGGMQGRIRSMALLHEYLHRPGLFASVDLGAYLRELARQAFQAQVTRPEDIRLELDLEPLQLSMDQALPAGLLVNELLCNSLKHGFPGQHRGLVRVGLHPGADSRRWCLEVSDTGVGLPQDFDQRRQGTLGLQLAGDLADQMGGMLDIRQEAAGSRFTVAFEPEAATVPVT